MGLQELNFNFNRLPKKFSKDLEGKWIAAKGGEIISFNASFKILFQEIQDKELSKKVIFHKVPNKEIIIV